MTRKRTIRSLWAVLAVLALLAGACGDDSGDDASGGGGEDVEIVLGAPQDCETNAFCLPGLESVYGVDLSENFTPLDAGVIPDALENGEITVALLFSTSGIIADKGWVVLEDDQQMLAADNIVPVVSDEVAEAYGDDLAGMVDGLSAAIDTETLTELNARFDIDAEDPDVIAADFLAEQEVAAPGDVPDGPTITIGTQDFGESAILAQIYGQALESAGYPVEFQELGGFRDLEVPAFEDGTINFAPEYVASMLEFLNQQAGEATSDVDETVALLQERLAEIGLQALTPAPAVDTNTFVVTPETSEELGLTAISDLAQYAPAG